MANPKLKLAENAAGAFYVGSTCISCVTCRQIAPQTFQDYGGQSSVFQQPQTAEIVKNKNFDSFISKTYLRK